MKLNGRTSKTYFFGKDFNRSICCVFTCWKEHPSIYFKIDGGERTITFHFAFFFGFWITFENMIPKRWYPKEWKQWANQDKGGYISAERTIKIYWYSWGLWWCLWRNQNECGNNDWRHSSWHPFRNLKGKHTVDYKELSREQFILPFLEGNYNIEVIKQARTDSFQRWFSTKSECFEVRVGYYKDGEFVELCVPREGKGENSWDQDEDGTFSMYFPAKHPGEKYPMRTCYEAALYFWQSCMRDRERYGNAKWRPKKFRQEKISFITEMPIS